MPIFEKMGKELSVLFTPETLHLVQGAADSGGLELHADLLKDEGFDAARRRTALTTSNGIRPITKAGVDLENHFKF